MSHPLISRSPDLSQLHDEGYEIEIISGHLVVHSVPYVTSEREVGRGTLISKLDLSGDITTRPTTHVVAFCGEYPCDAQGNALSQIKLGPKRLALREDLIADHRFSCRPKDGYANYYDKMTTYVAHISGPARDLDPEATAQTYGVRESSDRGSPFNYEDTASSRTEIADLNSRLTACGKTHAAFERRSIPAEPLRFAPFCVAFRSKYTRYSSLTRLVSRASHRSRRSRGFHHRLLRMDNIAIVGLGGTGAYILDLVAKTPAKKIHLIDGDQFLQHNAFRAPGAASIEELRQRPKKVKYYSDRYSAMRSGIVPHPAFLTSSSVAILDAMNFVFLAIDKPEAKRPIVERLEAQSTPFIDVGMGLLRNEKALLGLLCVTTSTPTYRAHVHDRNRIEFTGPEDEDVYGTNIQVADLNALNAALAVIKWKKICGFYVDQEQEHFATYMVGGNHVLNEDKAE